MSCGDPHEADCSSVLDRVYRYLDDELDGADHDEVRLHLEECAPCLRQYGLEHVVKLLVARSCGCGPAPNGLRVRVLTRLTEVRRDAARVEFRAR